MSVSYQVGVCVYVCACETEQNFPECPTAIKPIAEFLSLLLLRETSSEEAGEPAWFGGNAQGRRWRVVGVATPHFHSPAGSLSPV